LAEATSRTPDGSKSTIRSQRQPQCPPRLPRLNSAPVRRIARSRIVPQEVGTARARGSFKVGPPSCQGVLPLSPDLHFSACSWQSGHIPARMRRHDALVNGVVTIRGLVWLIGPAEWGIPARVKILGLILDAAPCGKPFGRSSRASQGRTSVGTGPYSPEGQLTASVLSARTS
jgi:hypothetical protein